MANHKNIREKKKSQRSSDRPLIPHGHNIEKKKHTEEGKRAGGGGPKIGERINDFTLKGGIEEGGKDLRGEQ